MQTLVENATIPPTTRQRLVEALQTARQAQARYEELLVIVVETLGFDPKDPLLRIDLDHGVISIAPVANGHTPNGHD